LENYVNTLEQIPNIKNQILASFAKMSGFISHLGSPEALEQVESYKTILCHFLLVRQKAPLLFPATYQSCQV
jgi:hypothetical protein